ncbi:ScbR family autoregulator-binding transcription factor [Streptomyces sp. B6B3]|uniref:ScbR family autoregulator-binding transcription factor n=1 Tax=Streptomyces sp. B6B3 TaxID=3153570 RepID=UPI00325CB421
MSEVRPRSESADRGRRPAPRQERAIRTRDQILLAAGELFAERGYRATSVTEVARRARLTKGAVYFHFPSKERLAVALAEEHHARWSTMVGAAQERGLSPMETVEAMLEEACVAFQSDQMTQAVCRLQLERPRLDWLPTPYLHWTTLLTSLLTVASAAGELRPGVDPEAAARCLVAAFFGTQRVSDALTGREDLPHRWRETRDLLFPALCV